MKKRGIHIFHFDVETLREGTTLEPQALLVFLINYLGFIESNDRLILNDVLVKMKE